VSLVKAAVSDDPDQAGARGILTHSQGDQFGPNPVEDDRLRRRISPLS
jgi:hypothetical protein